MDDKRRRMQCIPSVNVWCQLHCWEETLLLSHLLTYRHPTVHHSAEKLCRKQVATTHHNIVRLFKEGGEKTHVSIYSLSIINPHAHAQQWLWYILGLYYCVCVCLSICYHTFRHHMQQAGQRATPMGSRYTGLIVHSGVFSKSTAFKRYSTHNGLLPLYRSRLQEAYTVHHVTCTVYRS